ncbi:MAG TPA: hypothetical protein PLE99_13405 [Candidatus Thiothrix moscowensis]|uniref:hypothetical protein n=1 Tax=unclassified Thiothrix TaxID=2636184 RepID=UPI0025E3A4D5|nr:MULTISPECIES: hypothetical protein [unclassified Thiothrix]HRJ53758.1 hypothetical protein [Candidatus Thiothrix moscowensis]HRJ93840.1 hypothetical protein [Candidatus Thiothrix moscowensis]
MKHAGLVITLNLFALSPAFALDAACEPIVKASETKIAQPAWHSVTEGDGIKLEAMKVDGQFFMAMDGKWQKAPMDMDTTEKITIGMMKDGTIQLSNCKEDGTETVDGVEMTVLSYHSDMKDIGSGTAKLYIGKADGLPYKLLSDSADEQHTQTIRYQHITIPTR